MATDPGFYDDLMTPDRLASRLGISVRSVREKVYAGIWPHLRLDKRTVRFTEDDYEEILAMSRKRPANLAKSVTDSQQKNDLAELLKARRTG